MFSLRFPQLLTTLPPTLNRMTGGGVYTDFTKGEVKVRDVSEGSGTEKEGVATKEDDGRVKAEQTLDTLGTMRGVLEDEGRGSLKVLTGLDLHPTLSLVANHSWSRFFFFSSRMKFLAEITPRRERGGVQGSRTWKYPREMVGDWV